MPASGSSHISSGISSYNPISNLELQYAAPVGHRLHLFVRLNPNCCLIGGVETLLKQKQNQSLTSIESTETEIPMTDGTEEPQPRMADPISRGDDPFSFLNQQGQEGMVEPTSTFDTSGKRKSRQKVGKFFSNLAKQTQQGLEKGITNLAIRADQGKNPDILNVGLYDASGTQLWCLTEPHPLPTTDYERMKGVAFAIPLSIPPQAKLDPSTIVTLKLWIKSGATLLKQTAKHYLLGQCHLSMESLRFSEVMMTKSFSLQSSVVVDGQLQLMICRDLKFPPLYGRSWSLTDPDMAGYAQDSLFHLPLDQSYGFEKDSDWWIATERATESSLVLPVSTAVAQLAQKACNISLTHATSINSALLANRHDSDTGRNATVRLDIGYFLLDSDALPSAAQLSIHWQRPDCIFETEIVTNTAVPVQTIQVPFSKGMATTFFYPKLVTDDILPAILQQYGSNQPTYLLGNVRILISLSTAKTGAVDPFAPTGTGSQALTAEEETLQAIFPLESYISKPDGDIMSIPVYHTTTGESMGKLILEVKVDLPSQSQSSPQLLSSSGGLTNLMGLDIDNMQTVPPLDRDETHTTLSHEPNIQRREQQLRTMGNFMTNEFLQNHVRVRSEDLTMLTNRVESYREALIYNPKDDVLPSHKDRKPKPFRPSSSRTTEELAGIPFNVHAVTLSIEKGQANLAEKGGFFFNVTCGAPADHARGFGPLFEKGPSGGLRRLEAQRLEWIQKLHEAQSALIHAVSTFFTTSRQNNQNIIHVPARNNLISALRWRVFELTHQYHDITWACTIRRVNVFSQALGIALTSYLTSISQNTTWCDLWVKHGYLVTFEGLLSAVGKELGMIEDASIGVNMLRNVAVQLVTAESEPAADSVHVVNSPNIKWVHMMSTDNAINNETQFILKLGINAEYFATRLAGPLKTHPVRLYPLLYQVGVDIRQAAAHAHMNAKSQLNPSGTSKTETEGVKNVSLLDDEDQDDGVADTDVLVALNYEALRKMNVYANAISPMTPASSQENGTQNQQIHPVLASLHSHIVGSSGKMNHGILDEAAAVAQKLGGGGVVFCKSGKDRTAMHVTYKQAQYIHRFLQLENATIIQPEKIYDDATKMRVYGTRLPICEKNVGQAKYAFNTLQVRFMPDMLKPPISTLAGFLKGGAVFKGGGIES
mmetsp:Transcript_111/g.127  ORF Transcript_111/g.127 Transcript_111/m.127 type:complete len:1163 (+) Transcript_111:144-3632(+)|eukprot:CAMPEP_0178908352 /NCGR_PEP_ID=MMETSP0786-20121207/7877_1 /TAXON_ID=186022 /ORGANISM="Thalassionema frauenfeldii, Strain CCMP 1798" /LENGTH=1162 /DNA_ID=CAMNT_0020580249 /DNA_START=33 /DNA_END=3521 /DNA_ORIENTATION=-